MHHSTQTNTVTIQWHITATQREKRNRFIVRFKQRQNADKPAASFLHRPGNLGQCSTCRRPSLSAPSGTCTPLTPSARPNGPTVIPKYQLNVSTQMTNHTQTPRPQPNEKRTRLITVFIHSIDSQTNSERLEDEICDG